MSLDVLNSPKSPSKIDRPNYTSLSKKAIKLDDTFQNYFKKTLIEDITCENCSFVHSETKKQHSQCGELLIASFNFEDSLANRNI